MRSAPCGERSGCCRTPCRSSEAASACSAACGLRGASWKATWPRRASARAWRVASACRCGSPRATGATTSASTASSHRRPRSAISSRRLSLCSRESWKACTCASSPMARRARARHTPYLATAARASRAFKTSPSPSSSGWPNPRAAPAAVAAAAAWISRRPRPSAWSKATSTTLLPVLPTRSGSLLWRSTTSPCRTCWSTLRRRRTAEELTPRAAARHGMQARTPAAWRSASPVKACLAETTREPTAAPAAAAGPRLSAPCACPDCVPGKCAASTM
mmetsp:Transcript_78303/g.254300  ORF Transcript_78303/g.254300 Transcript_78303/m.254300 type:complete len:276 (+) Transcript_78303:1485-2312(+)